MARLEQHRALPALLHDANPEGIRRFVDELRRFLDDLGARAGLPPAERQLVAGAVAQDAFPALVDYRRGRHAEAARLLLSRWRAYLGEVSTDPVDRRARLTRDDDTLLPVFSAVVAGALVAQAKTARAKAVLARLAGALSLSYDDLGRMLDVSGETARRWAGAATEIPEEQLAKLDMADAALTTLLHLFRPDRLPEVIRRPAALFDGESALDWIRRGRIADVAARYDRTLAYQA